MMKFSSVMFIVLLMDVYILSAQKKQVSVPDSSSEYIIKVHFLYGSKPKRKFKDTENKWFGGILGGHVGIEKDSGRIFNFTPNGRFHVFARKKECHSKFTWHDYPSFYSILGSPADSVKKLFVLIPISHAQKMKFDSIEKKYLDKPPFDYAFFGMRCGAAAYHVLAELGILKKYSVRKNYRKIFYPRKLRRRLIKKAGKNGWQIIRHEGTKRRKWEKD